MLRTARIFLRMIGILRATFPRVFVFKAGFAAEVRKYQRTEYAIFYLPPFRKNAKGWGTGSKVSIG